MLNKAAHIPTQDYSLVEIYHGLWGRISDELSAGRPVTIPHGFDNQKRMIITRPEHLDWARTSFRVISVKFEGQWHSVPMDALGILADEWGVPNPLRHYADVEDAIEDGQDIRPEVIAQYPALMRLRNARRGLR